MKYQNLYDVTLRDGGVTVDLKDGAALGFGNKQAKGYIVGAVVGTWGEPYADDTDAFDAAIDLLLDAASKTNWSHFGTFLNGGPEGTIQIDPVHVFASRDMAIGYALGTKQAVIFDLDKRVVIPVKYKR